MAISVDSPGAHSNDSALAGRPVTCWNGRLIDIAAWRTSEQVSSDCDAQMDLRPQVVLERARDAVGPFGLRHLVVGVIGPRAASERQEHLALEIGRLLGALSVTTICGGRSGVMEAVSRGVYEAGGLSIGILPDHGPETANPFVSIPLPTGLSEGRNMVIARAARVLIAVGGSYGTLTEMAYGLHFGKVVIALDDAPEIDGLTRVATTAEAIEACCAALLRQAEAAPPLVSSSS